MIARGSTSTAITAPEVSQEKSTFDCFHFIALGVVLLANFSRVSVEPLIADDFLPPLNSSR